MHSFTVWQYSSCRFFRYSSGTLLLSSFNWMYSWETFSCYHRHIARYKFQYTHCRWENGYEETAKGQSAYTRQLLMVNCSPFFLLIHQLIQPPLQTLKCVGINYVCRQFVPITYNPIHKPVFTYLLPDHKLIQLIPTDARSNICFQNQNIAYTSLLIPLR